MNLWGRGLRNEKNRRTKLKHVKRYILLLAFICGVGIFLIRPQLRQLSGRIFERLESYSVSARADAVNNEGFTLNYNGESLDTARMRMSPEMHLLMPVSEAAACFKTTVTVGKDGGALVGGHYLKDVISVSEASGQMLVDVKEISEVLGMEYFWEDSENRGDIRSAEPELLPESYDLRKVAALNDVESQGTFGTCWAFAAIGAMETGLGENNGDFSVDHMTRNSGFNISPEEGGDYNMALAYLASWKGPVYKADDPYGDGMTDSSLPAVKHLQEARYIQKKDIEMIKSRVMDFGGVESSLYMSIANEWDVSEDYEASGAAYYYSGDMAPNHDVVIVGWDDTYSRENFNRKPEQDGAFICRNSWGPSFGEDGYFYVSYEDSNLGKGGVSYTRIEAPDNYGRIYQSDLLGWVGTIGYENESAWFANIYRAEDSEVLKALSFYATGENTSCDIFVVPDYKGPEDLQTRQYLGSGYFRDAGYYTMDIPEAEALEKGCSFAVMVRISTEGSERPVAIEYPASELTESADISDGRGYISYDGINWASAEEEYQCNLCLKAFTE